MRQKCGHYPHHKCSDCILRQTLPMLFHIHSWNKTQVVSLALSLFDMPAVPVFRSTASGEDMRVGTEGPPTIPDRQRESSQRTESNWSKRRHIEQIIYGWSGTHLKLRWNTRSFPTWSSISLSLYLMCTMFHLNLRFSIWVMLIHVFPTIFWNIDL